MSAASIRDFRIDGKKPIEAARIVPLLNQESQASVPMVRYLTMRTLVSIGCILCAASGLQSAKANDSSFWGDGATVFAFRDHRVQMLREQITIRYDQKSTGRRRWKANCVFTFKNLTNKTLTVQMGFPDWKPWGDASGHWTIADFVAEIGGKRVQTRHKAVDNVSKPRNLPNRMKLRYDAAYTWHVTFAPKSEVTVVNRYRFGGMSSNGPFAVCVSDVPRRLYKDVFWLASKPRKTDPVDHGDGLCQVVNYIVTTGRTWARRIGEAEIAIEIPPHIWPHMIVPIPRASQLSNRWIRWRFRNWRPTRNLSVVFVTPIPNEQRLPPVFNSPAQARAWLTYARRQGVTQAVRRSLRVAHRVHYGLGGANPSFYQSSSMYRTPRIKPTTQRNLSTEENKILQLLR